MMPYTYSSRPLARGGHAVVRTQVPDTIIERHPDSDTAASRAAALTEASRIQSEDYAALVEAQREWERTIWSAHRDLGDRQLRWQAWRSEQYDRLCREEDYVAGLWRHAYGVAERATVRAVERAASSRTVATEAADALDRMRQRYRRLTVLDAATKTAIRGRDVSAWRVALAACEAAQGAAAGAHRE